MRLRRNSVAVLLIAALLAAWLAAWLEVRWVAHRIARDEKDAVRRHAAAAAAAVRSRFLGEAAALQRVAESLADSPKVRAGLSRPGREGSRELFAALLETPWQASEAGGIEILQPEGAVVAWNGLTPVPGAAPLEPAIPSRRMEDGAVHLWYVVTLPVIDPNRPGAPLGSVRVGMPVEARDRLHPRFRFLRTPSDAAREDAGVEARVRRTPAADEDDSRLREPLNPKEPGLEAVIEVERPLPTALFASAARGARLRLRLLSAAALACAFLGLGVVVSRRLVERPFGARALASLLPWGLRWALLWLELPGRSTDWPVLDVNAYSNGALGGLFATPAEFLLTAAAALASGVLLVRESRPGAPSPPSLRAGAFLGGGIAVAGTWAVALGVQSAVRDATFEYFDPAAPVPAAAALTVLAALFLLTHAVLLLTWAALPREGGRGRGLAYLGGVLAAGTLALPAVPEMIDNFPFALGLGALALGAWLVRRRTLPQRVVLVSFFAAAALHFFFDAAMDEVRRRDILEELPDAFAPSDPYAPQTVEGLAESLAERPDVRALAITWTSSPPGREVPIELWRRSVAATGCDGAVLLKDTTGAVIVSLSINFPAEPAWAPPAAEPPERTVSWTTRLTEDERVDIYAAQAPVRDAAGRVAGSVVVALSPPGRSQRSASFPEAARAEHAPRERLPRIRVSRLPAEPEAGGRAGWPEELSRAAGDRVGGSDEPVWVRRTGGERPLETLFVRDADTASLAALTYEVPGPLRRGLVFLALFLWNGATALAIAVVVLVWEALTAPRPVTESLPAAHTDAPDPAAAPAGKGFFLSASARRVRRTAARFLGRLEHKILAFFLAVSLLPIVALSVFSRAVVSDRIESEVGADAVRAAEQARRLLVLERHEAMAQGVPKAAAVQLDLYCRQFNAVTGKDVSVYVPGRLGAASKPELYELGLQPRRMPARAYVALALEDGDSWLEDWTVGRHRYRIGFHALREAGRTSQVFAVPVLFHRREVDEETGTATILIFGSYGLVVLLLWAGALVLAEWLTRPVTQMVQGMRRVAGGDLGFRVHTEATGEFQELVDGFNRMTAELALGRETLARAEREAAWREMARQIAHEIKNPLTPMKLSAQEIARAARDRDPEVDAIVASGVRTIVQQIDLLGRIASEFSTFARLPVGKRVAQDVNVLVRDAAPLFERPEPAPVKVVLDLQDELPRVVLDTDEMRRVITNLGQNGVQAMPRGGTLTLRTRLARQGEQRWVRLRVSDTGVGISRETLARVFEPYFSTRAEGTGLGLAICRRIVEDLGGRIAVHSREGEGATFTIELPAAPDA